MVERLEREVIGRGAAETAAALSPEEAKIKEYEIKQMRLLQKSFFYHPELVSGSHNLLILLDAEINSA